MVCKWWLYSTGPRHTFNSLITSLEINRTCKWRMLPNGMEKLILKWLLFSLTCGLLRITNEPTVNMLWLRNIDSINSLLIQYKLQDNFLQTNDVLNFKQLKYSCISCNLTNFMNSIFYISTVLANHLHQWDQYT